MAIVYWIGFILLILFLVALDLGVFRKKAPAMTIKTALSWTVLSVVLALIFNVILYFIYEYGHVAFSGSYGGKGSEAFLQFFTGYLLEKSLSFDNIFVISVIFSYHQIPLKYQHRVLTYGILTAVVLRGLLITFGIALIGKFTWIMYVFGLFILVSGWRLLTKTDKRHKKLAGQGIFPRLMRYIPKVDHLEGDSFFVKERGWWKATPLFFTLLQIEAADLVFAVDSVPAIFSVTLDPFIVYTSNIFAILGLRALYFILAPAVERFHYLKTSLACLLIFIGVKMLAVDFFKIPNAVCLGVIILILGFGVAASIYYPKRKTH